MMGVRGELREHREEPFSPAGGVREGALEEMTSEMSLESIRNQPND